MTDWQKKRDEAAGEYMHERLDYLHTGTQTAFRAGADWEHERTKGLIEAMKHVRRELNNGQVLEPGGPNHDLIETALAAYEGSRHER